jgi:adenylate kinase family enzyme
MVVKLFVMGRPGSGKSIAARHIAELARTDWEIVHVRDYEILLDMYKNDTYQKFRPAEYEGFDVIDFSVLDEALAEVQRNVRQYTISTVQSDWTLIIVEFARDDYPVALKLFAPDVLRDAYFLFVDANMENCIERIYRRATNPREQDNHFVSEKILRTYYSKDICSCVTRDAQHSQYQHLRERLNALEGIGDDRVTILENNGSREQFLQKIDQFIGTMLSLKVPIPVS